MTELEKIDSEPLRILLVDKSYSVDDVVNMLKAKGVNQEIATQLVFSVAQKHRDEILLKREEVRLTKEKEDVPLFINIMFWMLAAGCYFFGVIEPIWYIGIATACAIVMFLAKTEKTNIDVPMSFISVLLYSYAIKFYFDGRSSFYKIEFLFVSGVVLCIIFFMNLIIEKILNMSYKNDLSN
jgi:hypothetical protein